MSEQSQAQVEKGSPSPKGITIIVNNNEVELSSKEVTGAVIKEASGVPVDFQLFLEQGKKLELIGNDQDLKVHEKERFRAVSGQEVA